MRVKFTDVRPEHVIELAENLCEEDRVEILGTGADILWGIESTVRASDEVCAASTQDGKLICMFGITTGLELLGEASPWFLATELIHQYRREVFFLSNRVLDHWLSQHETLTNYVDSRHARAISWLKHMGATFEEIPAFGIYRRPYYKFTLRK